MVVCAVAPEIEGHGGKYYNNCKECPVSALAENEKLSKLLWDYSTNLVNGIVDQAKQIH